MENTEISEKLEISENTEIPEDTNDCDSDCSGCTDHTFGSDECGREQHQYKHDKIEDIEALAKEMEECYQESVKEMKELQELVPRFQKLNKNTEKLFKYYFRGPWRTHRERIYSERPCSGLNVTGEDCIFDFYGDMNNLAKQNLKEMTLYLTDEKEF